jgi:hypothetical protein
VEKDIGAMVAQWIQIPEIMIEKNTQANNRAQEVTVPGPHTERPSFPY